MVSTSSVRGATMISPAVRSSPATSSIPSSYRKRLCSSVISSDRPNCVVTRRNCLLSSALYRIAFSIGRRDASWFSSKAYVCHPSDTHVRFLNFPLRSIGVLSFFQKSSIVVNTILSSGLTATSRESAATLPPRLSGRYSREKFNNPSIKSITQSSSPSHCFCERSFTMSECVSETVRQYV